MHYEKAVLSNRLHIARTQVLDFRNKRKNLAPDHPGKRNGKGKKIRKNSPNNHPFEF